MANCFTSGHPKSFNWHWNSVAIKSVSNLDVHLDSTLRMQIHVAKATQTYFYQPRRPASDSKTAQSWCHRQDRSSFCADVIELWQCSTRWTVVLNPCTAAAHYQCRYVAGVRLRNHITDTTIELHWLPICMQIHYKLHLFIHRTLNASHQATLPSCYILLLNNWQDIQVCREQI